MCARRCCQVPNVCTLQHHLHNPHTCTFYPSYVCHKVQCRSSILVYNQQGSSFHTCGIVEPKAMTSVLPCMHQQQHTLTAYNTSSSFSSQNSACCKVTVHLVNKCLLFCLHQAPIPSLSCCTTYSHRRFEGSLQSRQRHDRQQVQ